MAEKMKFPSWFRNREEKHTSQWPSFHHTNNMFRTLSSAFIDPVDDVETQQFWFTNSSESASYSTESEDFDSESVEMVIRSVRSDRLFFEPGDTSSILEEEKGNEFLFKESVFLAMESRDPYEDFKRSMEEMVESYGLNDWAGFEELLLWYLNVNGPKNHGDIVLAFAELLLGIASIDSMYSL